MLLLFSLSTRLRNSPLKAESFVEHQLKLVISSILERVQDGYHMLSQGLGEIAHIDPNILTGTSKFYPQREKNPDQGIYPLFYRRVQETIWPSWYRLQQCRSHGFLGTSEGNFSKSRFLLLFFGLKHRRCFFCWCWIGGCINCSFDCMARVSQVIVINSLYLYSTLISLALAPLVSKIWGFVKSLTH